MTRVAFTALAPFVSGAERSLQTTIRHLPTAGVESVVVGPATSALKPWCAANGVEFAECPLAFRDKWHVVKWWQSVRRMRQILQDRRIDVVHANQMWCYPAAGAAAGQLRIPRVCHLRDEVSRASLAWLCRSGVEALICISGHIRRQTENAWRGPGRMVTWLNPVEMPAAGPALPRPQADVVLGFAGQLRAVKGLSELLDALGGLATGRSWHLLIAGRDPVPGAVYEAECRLRATRPDLAGRVTFLGFLDDPAPLYRTIDLAVVPSLEEPLGRVPLEAATFGKPAVAFATGGLPDTVDDGRTGWLVPTGDWPAFVKAVARFVDNPEPSQGSAARETVRRLADPVQYANRLANLYAQLTGQRAVATLTSNREQLCAPC